jgi:hypothetical protein
MSDLPAYVALGVSVVAIVSSIGYPEWRLRRTVAQKRAVGPATDTRAALIQARTYFQDISTHGGRSTRYFLDADRKGIGQRLHDLADRTDDPTLCTKLLEVSEVWDNVWGLASPPKEYPATGPPSAEELERDRRADLQVEVARNGLQLCQDALSRLNELDLIL